jgi:actin related protein 2/3 complex subunit 2
MAYVVFVLFDRHFAKEKRAKTIDTLQTFRNYLHYHIKCSKSHLHTRMRNRVESLLKILNRAKQDLPVEKKTITGRTFVRKDAKK